MTTSPTAETVWTADWVQSVTGGRWVHPPSAPSQPLTGVGIDSRTLKPGQAFLAVKGDQFDGHQFTSKAIKAGASIAIVECDNNDDQHNGAGVLLVDNTLAALQKLAKAYREALRASGCHVIAVVGSNGKTTTRHLIHAVLSSTLKGTQSPKSFNNHLGVPLTLLGASLDDDFLVAEVGTNHPGEIDALGELLKPDAAVITCIGKEHMEFFKDLQGVANEEAAITRHLPDRANVFIESDAHQWVRHAPSFNNKTCVIIYPTDGNPATPALSNRQPVTISSSTTASLPLIAPHDRLNALAAVKVGQAMGVPDEEIKIALENVSPMPGRLEVKQLGQLTVIDDSYNANPESTLAALNVLANHPLGHGGRRVAILADMLELGDIAGTSHREVGQALAKLYQSGALQQAVLIGPLMAWTQDELKSIGNVNHITHHPEIEPSTPDRIAELFRPNDVVLLKGSRGMQLEKLLPAIHARFTDS